MIGRGGRPKKKKDKPEEWFEMNIARIVKRKSDKRVRKSENIETKGRGTRLPPKK
jgi:hypothetical protein